MLKSWKDIPIGGYIVQPGNSKTNKTGNWRMEKPLIDQQKCVKCQTCTRNCPEDAMKPADDQIKIDYDYCKGCGLCSDICPVKAIEMK
ncbi:MAG: 4Fe-4S dicluster domain-containing protein [Candidatus Moranbacteria bacterium]|nr:4Fe-4S dicluster domain-containing protein [Candidatus Moranbacteria bacterium]